MKDKLKNINKYRVVWVSCIFLVLIVILIMVMDYKINYEYLQEPSQKLYFYECDGEVCTTEVKDNNKNVYSSYDCWYNTCPIYKGIINDDYVLLEENSTFILYNYKTGVTVTSGYDSYDFINNDYIIVVRDEKYGVIDISDNIVADVSYDQIGYYENDLLKGYNTSNIIAKKGEKFGIISFKDGSIVEEFNYTNNDISKLLDIIEKQNLS